MTDESLVGHVRVFDQHLTVLHRRSDWASLEHGSGPRENLHHCCPWLGYIREIRRRHGHHWRVHSHRRNYSVGQLIKRGVFYDDTAWLTRLARYSIVMLKHNAQGGK